MTQIGRRRVRVEPTVARLRELLTYDPATGELHWRVSRPGRWRIKAGDLAGTVRPDGYRIVSIDGSPLLAHRIAWAMMKGDWPKQIIDHEDLDPRNCKWTNLREANPLQSAGNRGVFASNTNGTPNIRKRKNRFHVEITIRGSRAFVGSFETLAEAINARDQAKLAAYGSYARSL